MRVLSLFAVLLVLAGCGGKTAYETTSGVGKPVGTVLAATQAPIMGASESLADQSGKTTQNPYGR
jgi:hypothetical protein